MITISDATPQDGLPDTQWGFNDFALNFFRDAQGHLAEECVTNPNNRTTTCSAVHAQSIDGIYTADGDPESGLDSHVIQASQSPEPTIAEIEERLPMRLEPQDRLIRYHVPNSQNTYLVLRRPIYTDRCLSDPSSNTIWQTSINLPNAIALFSGNSNRNDYCADMRPQLRPRTSGQLRMSMPFHRTNNTELVGNDPDHPEEGSLLQTLRAIRAEIERPLNPNDERSVIAHRVAIQDVDNLMTEVTTRISHSTTQNNKSAIEEMLAPGIIGFLLLNSIWNNGSSLLFGGHFFYQDPQTHPRFQGLFRILRDWWNHRNDPPDPPASSGGDGTCDRVEVAEQAGQFVKDSMIGIGMGLATIGLGAAIAVLAADDETVVGILDDTLIPFLTRTATYTGARSVLAFAAAGKAFRQ